MDFLLEDNDEAEWGDPISHMIAGAAAGAAEHCGMFPLDTIKTHTQAIKSPPVGVHMINSTTFSIARDIISKNGFFSLFRGLSVVAAGAGPAHAITFSVYEYFKYKFSVMSGQHPISASAAGVFATLFHDGLISPIDALKQKMQLATPKYRFGLLKTFITIYRSEGILSLYAGYTTALTMNVPYAAIYFGTYETAKKMLRWQKKHQPTTPHTSSSGHGQCPHHSNMGDAPDTSTHLICGAIAGSTAAGITNPLDLVKTRLQVQDQKKYHGMVHAIKTIKKEEGLKTFMRGLETRVLFHSLSGAITWGVYEYVKWMLLKDNQKK